MIDLDALSQFGPCRSKATAARARYVVVSGIGETAAVRGRLWAALDGV